MTDYLNSFNSIKQLENYPLLNVGIFRLGFDEETKEINAIYMTVVNQYNIQSQEYLSEDKLVFKLNSLATELKNHHEN